MSASGAQLAFFFADDHFPNFEALALSPGMGWLLLTALVGLVCFFLAHRETWRRILLRMDDPRTLGVFRIVFALLTMFNVNGLWEHFEYLFTDQGMWTTDVAQEVRAKSQFIGFGDGVSSQEGFGFFSFDAFLEWAKGPNYSLLLFDSSPTFFWAHLAVFEISMLMLLVGFQTKWIKWVAWFCFHSITLRNTVYWEGTENIYRCWLFYLCLSRCGHAYSVDNWLRCRKLRKKGLLSVPGGPGNGAGIPADEDHPQGLQPIYRLIPAWPRMLMICQTAILYLDTGVVKNGNVWHAGDSFYYSLSLDHFYRLPPFQLGAWFGTNFFKLNTWIVHYWEACFPLILIGLVVRFRWRERIAPLTGRQALLARAGLITFGAAFLAAIIYAYPVHYRPHKNAWMTIPRAQAFVGILVPIVVASISVLIWKMLSGGILLRGAARRLFFPVRHPLHTLCAMHMGFVIPKSFRPQSDAHIRKGLREIDEDWRMDRRTLNFVLSWFFGRRFWLGLGLIFHIHLILLMNIGWFTPGAVATYICFLNGGELANLLHAIKRAAGRFVPAWRELTPPVPAEDPRLPHLHRDGYQLGYPVLFTALGVALVGVFVMVASQPDMWESLGNLTDRRTRVDLPASLIAQGPIVNWGFFAANAFLLLLGASLRQRAGYGFDKAFGPVIVLGVAAVGYLRMNDLASMAWSFPLTLGLTWLATRKRAAAPEPLPLVDPAAGTPRMVWAYGPVGRMVAGFLFAWQILGIAIWLLPDKDSLGTWRITARSPFKTWLETTHTSQGWQMFAPNPPRSNLFMRVLVHDKDGEIYDLNTDVYACLGSDPNAPDHEAICDAVYPIPWIWYSRQRKMNRRIAGGEGGHGEWYQKWHARWVCREWEREHGSLPDKVELVKITYRIASPKETAKNGPMDPFEAYRKTNHQDSVHVSNCETTAEGQLRNEMRERFGMPLVEEKKVRLWKKNRCRRWEKFLKDEAKARGEEVADDDPRFEVCEDDGRRKRDDAGKLIPNQARFEAKTPDAAEDAKNAKAESKD